MEDANKKKILKKDAEDVQGGIIGGADGPTSIFLSANTSHCCGSDRVKVLKDTLEDE